LNKTIGIIGLGVMGSNLSLNIERNNYIVSVFNRTTETTKTFIKNNPGKKIIPFFCIKKFIKSLKKPRKIILMVASGTPTDDTIKLILPYLSKKDIIMDGGNSFYKDSISRNNLLSKKGIYFLGSGISGGSKGALKGPSIMPGGDKIAYDQMKPLLEKIAAKSKKEPCVSYIGPNGSGHYVKMVHNGIEYSDMQLISETYSILKKGLGLTNKNIAEIFKKWNSGELNSYLIKITKKILVKKRDGSDSYLLDLISDVAKNKGTGTWTVQSALTLGEPLSLISESVFFRYISTLQKQRKIASKKFVGPELKIKKEKNITVLIEEIRKSLYLGKILAYSQGFSLMKNASDYYKWNLNLSKISKIFRSGCIIQAKFLEKISEEFEKEKNTLNLLFTKYFNLIANTYQKSLRLTVSYAIKKGIPIPALSASIAYYDSYRSRYLCTNLIQSQRDFFGSHTYERTDKKGIFTTNWESTS